MTKLKLLGSLIAVVLFNVLSAQAKIIFLDGIPASGKSTVARELKNQLHARGKRTVIIESDEIALSLNSHTPPWAQGVLQAIERAKSLAKSNDKNTVIIVDSFLWKELYDQLSHDKFYFVLVYAPLELVIHRFMQRSNRGTVLSQERLTHLVRDFLNTYFVALGSENQLVAHYGPKENLYACRYYNMIIHSANHPPVLLAEQIISSYLESNL